MADLDTLKRMEERALRVLQAEPIPDDAPDMAQYQRVCSDIRALLRIPPGEDIRAHYQRIYEAMKPKE